MSGRPLAVVGRFPPPLDGQAIATARLADLLAAPSGGAFAVSRHDVGVPEGDRLVTGGWGRLNRGVRYARLPLTLRQSLAGAPGPVLWASVSASALGHARDVVTVAPALRGRDVVGVVHQGNFSGLFRSPVTATTARAVVRRLRALVFLSDGLADRCAPFVPESKRWVVPNTIDAAAIPTAQAVEASRRRRQARPGVRLLFLSGMIPSKGYADVLGALAWLRVWGVDARASFVGRWRSDRERQAFVDEVAALGLTDHVEVVGGVGRDEVQGLLLDADVFVLPTTYPIEAQPLTVIEALAAGTPVVVTRWAGLPEMITDGREGRFVGAEAPAEIADAVRALAPAERWARASVAARRRFEGTFSPEVVGARWQETLSRV